MAHIAWLLKGFKWGDPLLFARWQGPCRWRYFILNSPVAGGCTCPTHRVLYMPILPHGTHLGHWRAKIGEAVFILGIRRKGRYRIYKHALFRSLRYVGLTVGLEAASSISTLTKARPIRNASLRSRRSNVSVGGDEPRVARMRARGCKQSESNRSANNLG